MKWVLLSSHYRNKGLIIFIRATLFSRIIMRNFYWNHRGERVKSQIKNYYFFKTSKNPVFESLNGDFNVRIWHFDRLFILSERVSEVKYPFSVQYPTENTGNQSEESLWLGNLLLVSNNLISSFFQIIHLINALFKFTLHLLSLTLLLMTSEPFGLWAYPMYSPAQSIVRAFGLIRVTQ